MLLMNPIKLQLSLILVLPCILVCQLDSRQLPISRWLLILVQKRLLVASNCFK